MNRDDRLPHATAELTVTRAALDGVPGHAVFQLIGFCCCGENLAPTKNERHGRPPQIALGTLISGGEGGESPTQTLHRMRSWSRTKYELLDWLRRLLLRHGDDLRLIIWDDSGFDIPWELFWLPPDRAGRTAGGWLGALATVTRWTTIQAPDGPVPYVSGRCAGDIAGYIAEEMREDRAFLPLPAERLAGTVSELFTELETPGPGLALIYVACHGTYGETGFELTLGGLSVGEVDWRTFARITDSGGLVFINACHSGRLITDPHINDATIRGFAEIFLRSGAYGFVGTAGAVLETEARSVAEHVLRRLREQPGVPVATLLRDYRRITAVAELPPVADRRRGKDMLRFVNSYMYLYFGGPETTVALYGGGG
ncbi:CHAT domain-containing protein [Actinoallomurus sp. CA-150999]|uniref:CHAT domain-containing protein n=1 Tax=Actinoallomurus sp. CA-150999 TaxID=3239887 RepID=UPI003D908945